MGLKYVFTLVIGVMLVTACGGGDSENGSTEDVGDDVSGVFYDATAVWMPREAWTTQDPAVGDVDGDGDLDVVLPGFFETQDRLLRNTGGRLVDDTAVSLPTDTGNDVHAELADVDADGDLDLYIAAEGPDRLLINDGSGHFNDQSAIRLPTDNDNSEDANFGDIDGDGDLDIVIANLGAGEPNRLLINNNGQFVDDSVARFPQQAEPSYTAKLADMDGDGDLDIVVGNYGAPSRVMLNDGEGRYVELVDAIPGSVGYVTALTPGDADGDGDLDLYEARFIGPDRLLINNGNGQFEDVSITRIPQDTTASYDAKFADLDADGDMDVVVARSGAPNALLINDGAGNYLSSPDIPSDADGSYGIGVGDFNQDGALDLIFTSWAGDQTLMYLNGKTDTASFQVSRVSQAQGSTTGGTPVNIRGYGLTEDSVITVGGEPLQNVKLIDETWISGLLPPGFAGSADVVVTLSSGVTTTLPRTFTYVHPPIGALYEDVSVAQLPTDLTTYNDIMLVDVNQDGDLDMVLAHAEGADRVLLGTSDDGFSELNSSLPASDVESNAVGAVDIDGDGDIDLVFARTQGANLLINDGSGTYTQQAWAGDALDNSQGVAFGDFNADSIPDVLVGRESRPDIVLLSGSGTHAVQFLPVTPGATADVRVADLNGDDNLDVLLTRIGMLDVLLLGDGAGGFEDASTDLPDSADFISFSADVGDIDNDGDLDIVVAVGGATGLNRLWRNDGGKFVDVTGSQWPTLLYGSAEVWFVDVDGDDDLDVFEVNFFGSDGFYLNDGAGNFKPWVSLPGRSNSSAVAAAIGDVNKDGSPDIALAVSGNRPLLFIAR